MNLKKMLLAGILSASVSASAGEIEDLRAELAKTKARIAELECQVAIATEKNNEGKDAFQIALEEGTLDVKMGMYFRKYQMKSTNNASGTAKTYEGNANDFGWGSAYIDMNYVSEQKDNLQFGIGFRGNERMYERNVRNADDTIYASRYDSRAILDDLWVKANFTDKSYVKFGRQEFGDIFNQNPSLGLKILVKEIDNISLMAGLWTEQVGIDYGASKMIDFDDVDGGGNQSQGKAIYFVNLKAKLGAATVTPFYYVQKKNASVGGLNIEIVKEMNDDLKVTGNITGVQLRDLANTSARDNTTEVYRADIKVDMGGFSAQVGATQTMDDPTYKGSNAYRQSFGSDFLDKNVDNDWALANDTRSIYGWLGANVLEDRNLELKAGYSNIKHDTSTGEDDQVDIYCVRAKYKFKNSKLAIEARNTWYDFDYASSDITKWNADEDMMKSELHLTYSFQLGKK